MTFNIYTDTPLALQDSLCSRMVMWSMRTWLSETAFSLLLQLSRCHPRFPAFAPADSMLMLDAVAYFVILVVCSPCFLPRAPTFSVFWRLWTQCEHASEDQTRYATNICATPRVLHDTETSYCRYIIIYFNVKRQNLVYTLIVRLIFFFYHWKPKLITVISASLT